MLKKEANNKNYKTVDILNVKVDFINISKALSEIENWVKTNKKYQIVTPNPEQVMLAEKDYRFRKILNDADLRIPDGVGLVWAAKWLGRQSSSLRSAGQKFFSSNRMRESLDLHYGQRRDAVNTKKENFCQPPRELNIMPSTKKTKSNFQRLAGIDLMLAMCKLAAQKKWRMFLLGGKDEVAKKAAEQIIIHHPSPIIHYYAGAADIKNETTKERRKTVEKINQFRPHFLFVAYGAPEQEKWIADNLPKLDVKVAMGIGGAFDYLADTIQRAPFCIRSLGFEWFWRLLHQPWRIKRQLALLKFVWLVLKSSKTTSKKP